MKNIFFHCIFATLIIFSAGCNNQTTPIGIDLIGDIVGTDFTDTISVEAYSVLEDSVVTSQLSANIVGNISDPVFGNTRAATVAEFTLSGSSVNFGESPIIDSVVLTLQLSGYYGDTTSKCNIRVHQLNDNLVKSDSYYQNSAVNYDPTPLNYNLNAVSIKPYSQVVVDTGAYNAHLRIRLSQAFGQYLLNNQNALNSNATSFLKGLCIDAVSHSNGTGFALITNLSSALSGIMIYYHNNTAQNQRYQLVCAGDNVHFTKFQHDYQSSQSSDFVEEVLNNNKTLGKKVLFLQGGGGVKTRISFPYLEDTFKDMDNRVVVHKAELVVTNVRPDEQFLIQPATLTLQGINKTTGAISFIPDDDYYTSSAYFGGTYDASKHEYRFRITNYIQNLILNKGNLSNSLNLVVRGAGVRANRLVLAGTDDPDSRLRLEISYSKY